MLKKAKRDLPARLATFGAHYQEIVMAALNVVRPNIEEAYAEMAKDQNREKEAAEWAEIIFKDMAHETS